MSDWRIIVAERGWIFVGKPHRDGDRVVIADCYNVRRWSTQTKDGIGGLAMRGPGKDDNDILDAQPTTRIHVLAIVAEVECTDEAWSKWHDKQASKRSKK